MDPGRVLFEYRPPRAHPIVYAAIILCAFVWATGSIENALRDNASTIYLAYGAPLAATLGFLVLMYPSDTRIFENGIKPSRPLVVRWHRRFIPWSELESVYPSYYDVTGAFVSPFASSDGKVTQMGLGLEWADGRRETIQFTPTKFAMWQPMSLGYKGAIEAVREAFGDRPLVAASETYTEEQAEAMVAEASKPFLPFFAIVFLFASAAPVTLVLAKLGVPVAWALPLGLIAPAAVSTRSFIQSQRRNAILDKLSKAAEYRRGGA